LTDPVTRKPADLAGISRKIERFIANYVSEGKANGLVIGLSGGLDSSVVLKLAVNALGSAKLHGLIMPSAVTPTQDVDDAVAFARELGVQYDLVKLEPIIQSFSASLPENERAEGNLAARVRMCLLYYHAAVRGCLVAGTSDKSEIQIGFFTKFGDGAADILPIADLYKTEVRRLATFLKVPTAIVEKKSSPRLWKDHLAEDEIGLSYEMLDPILEMLAGRKRKPKDVARKLGVSLKDVQRVQDMAARTAHKRRPVPFAKL
jgi:NAD+ synthase